MKEWRRIIRIIAMAVMLCALTPGLLPYNEATAEAAAVIKLNKKSLTLEVGKSETLKITGTKSKATWTTSNKAVATVSTAGKVTAKKAGTATITATVNKKKYTCKVTVKKPVNPYIKNAPFKARETVVGKINLVYPADWTNTILDQAEYDAIAMLSPSSADIGNASSILLLIKKTGEAAPEYDKAKEYVEKTITEDYIVEQLKAIGLKASISDLSYSDYKASKSTVFVSEYTVDYTMGPFAGSLYQTVFSMFIDNYNIELIITDTGIDAEPDIYKAAQYLLESAKVVK